MYLAYNNEQESDYLFNLRISPLPIIKTVPFRSPSESERERPSLAPLRAACWFFIRARPDRSAARPLSVRSAVRTLFRPSGGDPTKYLLGIRARGSPDSERERVGHTVTKGTQVPSHFLSHPPCQTRHRQKHMTSASLFSKISPAPPVHEKGKSVIVTSIIPPAT